LKSSSILVAILLLALAVRLGIGVFLGFDSGPDRAACGADTVEFEHMAWSAAHGNGFTLYDGGPPTAFRAPGYPLLLGGLYKLLGRAWWVNRVVLSLLGTGTCWLIYLLAVRLRLGGPVALLAALLTAVLPLQFYWCGHFMSEPLAAFLNVATCLAIVAPPGRCSRSSGGGKRALLLAGILCGLAALTRPAALLVLPLLAVMWLVQRRMPVRVWLLRIAVFALGAVLAVAPWTIRNRVVLGRFALITTNGGSTFWGANNDIVSRPGEKWGAWITTTRVNRARKEREVWSLPNEVDRDKKEWRIGLEWVGRNPGRLPVLLAGKFWRLVKPLPDSPNRIYVLAVAAGWIFLLPTSLCGMGLVLRDPEMRPRFIPLNAQLLTLLATTAVFYGSERFRAPYEPFLAVCGAVAVGWMGGIAAKRHKRTQKGGAQSGAVQ